MAKPPSLAHVKYVRSKGRVYAYFNTGRKVGGKTVYSRLPDPGTPGFYDSYASLVGGRNRRAEPEYLVKHMVDDYCRSVEFRRKSEATQRNYHLQFGKVVSRLGKFPVGRLTPVAIRTVLDGEAWGAATCNLFLSVIGAAYTWGRQRGKTDQEPTKDIGRQDTGQHEPWPEAMLEAALTSDNARLRLAVHLLYYTGQRLGDVCAMRWNNIRGGLLTITQQKTGKLVSFPVHSALRAELDATPRHGLTILTGPHGRRIADVTIRKELVDYTLGQGGRYVPHGLRKNAVNALLECGCTIAEVAAITGQTYGVVEHYAKRVNTARLGAAAMLKFEARKAVE
jgi:integrase